MFHELQDQRKNPWYISLFGRFSNGTSASSAGSPMVHLHLRGRFSGGTSASSVESTVHLHLQRILPWYICIFGRLTCGTSASSAGSPTVHLCLQRILPRYICVFGTFSSGTSASSSEMLAVKSLLTEAGSTALKPSSREVNHRNAIRPTRIIQPEKSTKPRWKRVRVESLDRMGI